MAEARAGIETRSLALSSDGRLLAVGNAAPHALVVLDADLQPVKILAATDAAKRRSSAVTALADAAARRSFVAALPDLAEIWEIAYDPSAPEIAEGLVHDYKLREGAFVSGYLNPRRVPLEDAIADFRLAPDGRQLVGAARDGTALQVVHLDVRRGIAKIELPGGALPGAGAFWQQDGRTLFVIPALRAALLSVIDSGDWSTVKQFGTAAPGLLLRSHPASRYAFLDAGRSPAPGDTLQVIDRQRLEVAAALRPAPGSALGNVEFDRRGRHALASLQDAGGALVAYDASTLREVKRLSIRRPVGKYNVFNRIRHSEGNSH